MVSDQGWQYKENAGACDGVTKVKLLGGGSGESKIQVKAKGVNVQMPSPASTSKLLNAGTSVRVQLHDSSGTCYDTTFLPPNVIKNEPGKFKAKF